MRYHHARLYSFRIGKKDKKLSFGRYDSDVKCFFIKDTNLSFSAEYVNDATLLEPIPIPVGTYERYKKRVRKLYNKQKLEIKRLKRKLEKRIK